MGTTISMSSLIKEADKLDSFKSVYLDYSKFSQAFSLTLWELASPAEIKSLLKNGYVLTNWKSGTATWVKLNLELEQLDNLLSSDLEKERNLTAEFALDFGNGYEVGLDLKMHFNQPHQNGGAQDDGSLKATCNLNDLMRPVIRAAGKKTFSPHNWHKEKQHAQVFDLHGKVIEKLFSTFCEGNIKPEHCFGYLEAGPPLAAFCFSVYHNKVEDYLLDLWRMFIGLRYDVSPVAMYNLDSTSKMLSMIKTQQPANKKDYYHQAINESFPGAIDFFEEITVESLEQINTLSEKKKIDTVNQAIIDFATFEGNEQVRLIKDAPYLLTNPTNNVWHFYKFLYQYLKKSSRA